MKKLLLLFLFCLISTPAFAETVIVQALNSFSTSNPPSTIKVKILSDITLDENLTLSNGDLAEGKIINVKEPKRLKRNATFAFQLVKYTPKETGVPRNVTKDYTGKYTTQLNKADIAKSAALTVGNHFIHGISVGFTAIEGAVKNEEDNRLKSSAVAVYESTPISYIRKGEELTIKQGEAFYLKFKTYKEDLENPEE